MGIRRQPPKMTLSPKLDAKGKPIHGRFLRMERVRPYVPRLFRGSIELPIERERRAKADEKRQRKAAKRIA